MIKANFNAYASYVTDTLYQWDINQSLVLTGLNLSSAPEVHFSNGNMDRAIVRQASNVNNVVSVAIPNSLLQDPLTITAHVGVYEGETFKVIEKVVIPVNPRKRPYDYKIEDTDEEIYSFKALENKLENVISELQAQYASVVNEALISLTGDDTYSTTITLGAMLASKWSSNTYSFEDVYPVSKYNIEIALDSSATVEQAEAFNSAQIVGSATSNIVKAYGTVPSVDIPIIIKAVAL